MIEEITKSGLIMFHPELVEQDAVSASAEGGRIGTIVNQLVIDGLWGENVYEADMAPLKRLRDIHDEEYLKELHRRTTSGISELDPRTPVMAKSFELARIGVGEVLDAVDMIMNEEISRAFCLTPMPGNEAGIKNFGGGSLVNAAAAGAHYLTKKYQLKKIAILNVDANHARGTQEIFWKRRDVLFFSIHEYPGQSGTGHYSEIGDNPAKGYNINIPCPSGYGDREFHCAFQEIVLPILKQYEPEFTILSWGTSALQADPRSHLVMTEFGMLNMLQEILGIIQSFHGGRCISILEGGTPGKAMARAVSEHVMLLLNNRFAPVDKGKKSELVSYTDWYSYAKVLKAELRKYWRI